MAKMIAIIFVLQEAQKCFLLVISASLLMIGGDNDPRIHKDANCRYRDNRTCLDIVYELIKADMLMSDCARVGDSE